MNIVWQKLDGSIAITHAVIPPESVITTVPILISAAVYEDREVEGEVVSVMTAPDVWGEKTVIEKTRLRDLYDTDMDAFLAAVAADAQANDPSLAGAVIASTKVTLPSDRTFRGAWKAAAGAVDVDMPKAREIHMDRIRQSRDKALVVKGREYMIADEKGHTADKQAIAAEKQVLRDLPQTFDLSVAKTTEELVTAWPAELDR